MPKQFRNAFDKSQNDEDTPPSSADFLMQMVGASQPQKPEPEVIEVIPEGAIVPAGDGKFMIDGWEMTPVGLHPPQEFTKADWERIVGHIQDLSGSLQWVIGDLLCIGTEYGVTYQEFAERTGYEVRTLYNLKNIASKVDISVRFPAPLTIGHHDVVTNLSKDEQYEWLRWAYDNRKTVQELRDEVKGRSEKKQVSKIDAAWTAVIKKMNFIAQNIKGEQRKIVAAQLRAMADELEK